MREVADTDSGVTVLQTMLVVIIIGMLVYLAVPIWARFAEESKTRTCQSNQRSIVSAIALVREGGGVVSVPVYFDAVLEPGHGWGAILIPHYLAKAPTCPSPEGGLYNLSPLGRIWSDRGVGQYVFVNQGLGNDHRLTE